MKTFPKLSLIPLLAGVFSVSGLQAQEAATTATPLWGLQVRLSGGKNPKISSWIREVFQKNGVQGTAVGANTIVRLEGFENQATPAQDWVAEVRELGDASQLLAEMGKKGKTDAQGRVILEHENGSLLLWSPDKGVLRVASPPENAGYQMTKVKPLAEDTWLLGAVDFAKIPEKMIESEILKKINGVVFTASSNGKGSVFDMEVKVASAEIATQVAGIVKELQVELSDSGKLPKEVEKLPLKLESKGNTVEIKVELSDEQLETLIQDVKSGLENDGAEQGEEGGISEF